VRKGAGAFPAIPEAHQDTLQLLRTGCRGRGNGRDRISWVVEADDLRQESYVRAKVENGSRGLAAGCLLLPGERLRRDAYRLEFRIGGGTEPVRHKFGMAVVQQHQVLQHFCERGAPVDERVKALVAEAKVTALCFLICPLNPFSVSAPLFSLWP
jgi:hypothetical protein